MYVRIFELLASLGLPSWVVWPLGILAVVWLYKLRHRRG